MKIVAIARRMAPKITRVEELRGGLSKLGVTPGGGGRTPILAKGLFDVVCRSDGGGGILEAMAHKVIVEMATSPGRVKGQRRIGVWQE